MAESRRKGRSSSFHEEGAADFATPQYIPSSQPPPAERMKLTLDPDDNYPIRGDDDDDDDEEEEEVIIPRGRSRSRSVHSRDDDNQNAGVIPFDPSAYSGGAGATSLPEPPKVEKVAEKPVEKTGPLPQKELLLIQEGIEEALQKRDPETIREEKEEVVAAEEEKQQRSSTLSRNNSSSGDSRRIKILMLGDSGVGKSSLMIRWTADKFSTDLSGTVGVNYKSKKLTVGDENILVQVWDTAGQEQFHKITTSYYKGAHGIMLVFDVTDTNSLKNIEYWVKNIKAHASDSVQVALVGNKTDLRTGDPSQCLDSSHGQAVSQQYGVPYFETSAKTASNVEGAFESLVMSTLGISADGPSNGASARKSIVEKEGKSGKKKGGCPVS